MTKYIFVTGGVTSSLGKGIVASSIGVLLQSRGLKVTIQKFDPYINVDPGTLNPYEHGECYVTDDGAETDLDLGHYERFLNISTSQANNVTTGRVYQTVISKEREGAYLGKTVQVIPHITDEIKRCILQLGSSGDYDVIITELGGTVGDIESLPYVESVRQLKWELGSTNAIVVHLTLIPYLSTAKELKTKPTQHSVKELSRNGLTPDLLVCRTDRKLGRDMCSKLARFCNVDQNSVIEAIDAATIYDVPILLQEQQIEQIILAKLRLSSLQKSDISEWKAFLKKLKNPDTHIEIGLVGKYIELQDAYKSILESFIHAGARLRCRVSIRPIHSEDLDQENTTEKLAGLHGILVAPGFGNRGVEGKIAAIRYVRENKIPFFGICLGMQCAVIEFARNVMGLSTAHSREMEPETAYPIIDMMEEQKNITTKGGTMRLGAYDCDLVAGSKIQKAYGSTSIQERHRHRYELNNQFLEQIESAGLSATGTNPQSGLVEAVELEDHPWFVGVQFHPEFKSRVTKPHPLFVAFVKAAMNFKSNGSEVRKNQEQY